MKCIESKYLQYGESKFEFMDSSPEQMKEVNRRLEETLREREILRAKISKQQQATNEG